MHPGCAGNACLCDGLCDVAAVQVTWTQGVTQGGSSGSPLIDVATHRVVGVLTGGLSSCDTAQSPDYYGRLARVRKQPCAPVSRRCAC